MDTAEIQKILSKCFENLNSNDLDNPEEMHRFLDTYELPKLNQEYIKISNNLITPGN